jgi:hypothetical protein
VAGADRDVDAVKQNGATDGQQRHDPTLAVRTGAAVEGKHGRVRGRGAQLGAQGIEADPEQIQQQHEQRDAQRRHHQPRVGQIVRHLELARGENAHHCAGEENTNISSRQKEI